VQDFKIETNEQTIRISTADFSFFEDKIQTAVDQVDLLSSLQSQSICLSLGSNLGDGSWIRSVDKRLQI
jgi:hypothetical protein